METVHNFIINHPIISLMIGSSIVSFWVVLIVVVGWLFYFYHKILH